MNEFKSQCSDQYVQSCVLDLHCVYFDYTEYPHYFTLLTLFVTCLSHIHIDGPLWEALCLSGVNH